MEKADFIADDKDCDKIGGQFPTIWTKEILMACLKRIVHKDVFSNISKVDIHQFTATEKFNNDVVKRYLQLLMKNADSRFQMYSQPFGTVESLLRDLLAIRFTPHYHKYVNLPTSSYYRYTNPRMLSGLYGPVRDFSCCSKSDILLMVYGILKKEFGEKEAERICAEHFKRLEGCYELEASQTVDILLESLVDNLSLKFIEHVLQKCFYILEPCGPEVSPNLKCLPTLRVITDSDVQYCFAKEAEIAVRMAFKYCYPQKEFPEDWNQCDSSEVFIRFDNVEDRALGILHVVEIAVFERLLEKLGLTPHNLLVFIHQEHEFQKTSVCLPIISPYGTHCQLAVNIFMEFMDYFVIDLRAYQKVKRSNVDKITKWLKNLDILFDKHRNYPYIIENWKCDELKKKAHNDLNRILTEPVYNIPVKPWFDKRELEVEIKKFTKSISIEQWVFEHLYNHNLYGPKYTYWQVCNALVKGTNTYTYKKDQFKTFFYYQIGKGPRLTEQYLKDLTNSHAKACSERSLPPALKYGKNDLGEVSVPKSKKTVKPDFSKKIDKEAVMMEALRCFDENFEHLESFKIEKLKEYFGEEEWEHLKEVLENEEKRKKIEDVFDIEVEAEIYTLKRKSAEYWTGKAIEEVEAKKKLNGKLEKLENEQKLKDNEIEELNKKMADIVQKSIEKIQKSKEESGKENEQLRNELELANKNLEEAMKNTTTQKSVVKQKYRDEVNKLNRICEEKENKIQKLHEELRECREELRNEREERNNQIDRDLKMANESIRRKDIELEALKFWKTSKTVEISELTEKNRQLETKLEIAEMGSSSGEELQEHQQEHGLTEELLSENEKLTSELQKLTKKYEDLERRMFSGLRGSSKIEERLKNYEKIMNTDYEEMIDGISSNLHRLAKLYPNSAEIQEAKLEVRNFDENYEEYIGNVKKEYERMKENMNDELGAEIQEFPSQEFWEKYRKWVEDNDLEL